MSIFALPFNYLWWHYGLAWRDLFNIYRNFLWFIYHFFSLSVLIRTLFAPWKRLGESYPTGFNLGGVLATFFINSLMRLIGFVIRLSMLIFGSVIWLVTLALGLIAALFWLVLPILLVCLFITGWTILIADYV